MENTKNEALGRCIASMQYPKIEDDSNLVQMTARLNGFNNTLLMAYCQISHKNKNDALNEILELGLTTLRDELQENNSDLYALFNNICHEIGNS